MFKKIFLLFTAIALFNGFLFAEDKEEKFNAGQVVMHHVLESHDWELTEYPVGEGKYGKIAIHLPWILYSAQNGVEFYGSTEALLASNKYIVDEHHGAVYVNDGSGVTPAHHEGGEHEEKKAVEPTTTEPTHKVDSVKTEGAAHAEGETAEAAHEEHHDYSHLASALDLSPTKTVLHMFLVGIALILVFSAVKKGYVKNRGKAPSGIQSFAEPIIVFVRDFAKEYIGKKYEAFVPYLLTLFFFIWFANLFGLTPLNSNIAGNISVTAALAFLSLIIINVNGTKDYWTHIFWPPGVPMGLNFLLTIVEFLGVFIKPISLAIRLFANIAAGHFMVLCLICLIFIFGDLGKSIGGATFGVAIGIPFSIAIMCLEMLVAAIQAYIFTLLTCVFLGMAMESHDHHEEHAHH